MRIVFLCLDLESCIKIDKMQDELLVSRKVKLSIDAISLGITGLVVCFHNDGASIRPNCWRSRKRIGQKGVGETVDDMLFGFRLGVDGLCARIAYHQESALVVNCPSVISSA